MPETNNELRIAQEHIDTILDIGAAPVLEHSSRQILIFPPRIMQCPLRRTLQQQHQHRHIAVLPTKAPIEASEKSE
jgi:hypothetical protein